MVGCGVVVNGCRVWMYCGCVRVNCGCVSVNCSCFYNCCSFDCCCCGISTISIIRKERYLHELSHSHLLEVCLLSLVCPGGVEHDGVNGGATVRHVDGGHQERSHVGAIEMNVHRHVANPAQNEDERNLLTKNNKANIKRLSTKTDRKCQERLRCLT